jgi:hypothetical protein
MLDLFERDDFDRLSSGAQSEDNGKSKVTNEARVEMIAGVAGLRVEWHVALHTGYSYNATGQDGRGGRGEICLLGNCCGHHGGNEG